MWDEARLRQDLADVAQRIGRRGLVAATEGNVSVRLSHTRFLITPSGRHKGDLEPADMVVIDPEGNTCSEGTASSERRLHLALFDLRPDVDSVVHAHPQHATGWAMARRPLPWKAHPEVVVVLGAVGLAPYRTPSTWHLARETAEKMREANACLLANHGAVTVGASLEEAYYRMEILESFAQSCLVAAVLGGPVELEESDLTALGSR